VIKFVSDLRHVGGFLPSTLVYSTNKIDRHNITDILLKHNNTNPNSNPIYRILRFDRGVVHFYSLWYNAVPSIVQTYVYI